MASLNLKGDYGIEILSYYLWGESTPPSNLARKDNRVLIAKDYKARDEKAKITIQASALDYMKFVDRYTSATDFGVFQKFFECEFSEKELEEFKGKIENEMYVLGLDDIVKTKMYKGVNPFISNNKKDDEKYDENKMAVEISHYYLDINSSDYAKRSFAFGSTSIAFNKDVKFHINVKTYKAEYISNLKLYPLGDNFDFKSDDGFAKYINLYLEYELDPLEIGRKINIEFIDQEKIEPIVIYKRMFEILQKQSFKSPIPFFPSFKKYYDNNILPSGVLYLQDDHANSKTHSKYSAFFSQNEQNNSSESSSSAKEPCFITLYLKDEHNKPIANAKIIIKGFKHDKALRVLNLKRCSDEKGKIRFDKEKYFSDCYSFKVKLDEKEAYFSTPLQNAKRIFNNYINHKEGLVLKFKAKDHLIYDGFNVYHYKGNDLINSYMARSGTAKADNKKRSKKQIAHYFYQDEKDKSKSGKAYFYYDDESIKDRFASLPEGEYYLKINEIDKDTNPSFLKDYPFEIGKTWGRYCVRLYTDKECSKTSKEIEIKESNEKENKKSKKDKKEQSIIKDNLYLYSINEKGEFGSSGSIGMAQAQLLENLSKQAKFIQSEEEGIISLRVEYAKQEKSKVNFIKEIEWELDEDKDVVNAEKSVRIIIDEKANFAPGTYVECEVDGLEDDVNIVWALAQIQNEARLQRILEGKEHLEFKDIKFLKDESKYFHECWEMDDEEKDEEFEKIGFSLPLTRANEEEFDKYYALVFAYEDKNKFKRLPNLNDAYKIIDMSFKVGSGRDDRVKELFTREELKAFNVYNLNRQKSIDSVEEANWFLRANLRNQEKRDFFTYLRTYPQFAGKIAYIYYRFDLINKEFLTSVSEKDKEFYLQDRDDKYISTIINKILPLEYKNGKSFKQFHTELLNNKNRDLEECKDFLKALTQTLCKEFDLPLENVVFYSEKPSGSLSFGAYKENKVRLNQYILKAYFKEFAKTVFHECRHFYIEKYYNHNTDALGRYVFYSEKAYINEKIIFDKFSRICDSGENYLVGCNIGAIQDAYEIQPNERDPRYVETLIGRSL
ncbi:hypothetical protein [Campylobacter cuniculorum]|uniref:Uncharacterized protein n=1 Tax=Campylobacter cuniculorum DSM 23162 = LMG 24588 TaxID=1121267 RepID=A0A1W6BUQ0_9BACT|nr:hypothetical protein [Campylobacter cuniculorum]ARJ55804.1 hypothetical protein CCUN_0145 [Campylobacter cuniculorum DSM 23162 = LMG 24588]